MKKDNSTFILKSRLRQKLLSEFGRKPVIMESHGGYGALYAALYTDVEEGIVFEIDKERAQYLAKQRPTWACYAGDAAQYIKSGVGNWLEINYLDFDPHGSPWPFISAFFDSDRPYASRMAVAVNDGMRQKLQINGGWDVHELQSMVEKYGVGRMHKDYLQICRELLAEKIAHRDYKITRWAGYHYGHAKQMTHYAAVIER